MQKRYERSLPFLIWPFEFVTCIEITVAYEERTCLRILAGFIRVWIHFSSGLSGIIRCIIRQWQNYHEYPFFRVIMSES